MADIPSDPSTSQCDQGSESSTSVYELTPVGDARACAGPSALEHQQLQHDIRKRKSILYSSSDGLDMSGCDSSATTSTLVAGPSTSRKRKNTFSTVSPFVDDGEDSRSTSTVPDKKQNHSEIEKRRRDKMNTYISELSSMIPMCGAMARKLDKLTVLRMAVQHLRTVRGALSACPLSARPRPAFIPEQDLNTLILDAANDCFLLVVGCDRGRLLYVSSSAKNVLQYEHTDLLGQSLFDILHPKDVAKVKEQLSSSDLSPRERLIDAKTMLPLKADLITGRSRLCPGTRRSFFCRIKCKAPMDGNIPVKQETETNGKMSKKHGSEKKYCVVQCTGYLKSWAPADISESGSGGEGVEDDSCSLSCLVAVGRALPDLVNSALPPPSRTAPVRQLQYVSRHAPDGKFLFVDQRVTLALGFLPQELLGTSLYEYVSGPELGAVARAHKTALLEKDMLHTPPYSFRRKDGSLARIQTHFKPFKNPWTKDVECLVANNTVITDDYFLTQEDADLSSFDIYKQKTDVEMQRLIESQVESHKIGSAIAEEVYRRSSTEFSPDLPTELLQDAVFNQQASLVDNILGVEMDFPQVRNNVPLSSVGAEGSPPPASADMSTGTPPPASPPLPSLGLDGNGEAAMAVIMSLLEADAGLGGPVNCSGLPWPLP